MAAYYDAEPAEPHPLAEGLVAWWVPAGSGLVDLLVADNDDETEG